MGTLIRVLLFIFLMCFVVLQGLGWVPDGQRKRIYIHVSFNIGFDTGQKAKLLLAG